MSYLTGQSSAEPSVSVASDSMDSDQPTAQSDGRPRVMGVILSISATLIISTNLLVAAALLKLLLKRGCQSWCFVLNLAVADTLVGVAITGLATEDFSNLTGNHGGHIAIYPPTNATPPVPKGKTRCLLRMAFLTSPCMVSILSMFLISLDRYVAIKMPLRYSMMSGKGKTAGSLLAVWISSFTMGFLPVMVRELQAAGPYDGFCAFFTVIHDIAIIVLYCLLFFPVLSLFIYMYLDILKIACVHHKQISQIRQTSSRADDNHHGPSQYHHHHPQHHLLRSWSHVKALRTVAVLVGCFLVLWSPFFVVCIVHLLCRKCALKEVLENYLWLLGLLNSLINPLVYACWQREVRLQLSAMFSCITSRLTSAAPPSALERSHSSPPAQTHACVSEGDAPSPSIMLPISSLDLHAVLPSDTTSL